MSKDGTGFDRKVKVEIEISGTELSCIAADLSRGQSVQVNWYGVQILFKPELKERPTMDEKVKEIERRWNFSIKNNPPFSMMTAIEDVEYLLSEVAKQKASLKEGLKLFEESAKEIRRLREGIKNCHRVHDSPNWSSCSSCIYNLKERI